MALNFVYLTIFFVTDSLHMHYRIAKWQIFERYLQFFVFYNIVMLSIFGLTKTYFQTDQTESKHITDHFHLCSSWDVFIPGA